MVDRQTQIHRRPGMHATPGRRAGLWTVTLRDVPNRGDVRPTALQDSGTASCASLCDVEEITHRQMRNESADVLRRVAGGETILVTNNGQPAAVISPPPNDALTLLAVSGQLREAVDPPSQLRSIERSRSSRATAEIVAEARGRQ